MRCLLALMVALLLSGPARADPADAAFRAGLAAYNEGAYGRAQAAWGPLAAAGDARAQAGLGFMEYSGRGVVRDSARAADLFGRAADQGEPTAQLFLALMYFKSDGLPSNPPLAMMWIELAVGGGQPGAFEWRAAIMQALTEPERQEGWRLLAQWRDSHPGKNAGKTPGTDAGK
jgi:TPR repeat protein